MLRPLPPRSMLPWRIVCQAHSHAANNAAATKKGGLAAEVRAMAQAEVPRVLEAFHDSLGYDPSVFATVAQVVNEDIDRWVRRLVACVRSLGNIEPHRLFHHWPMGRDG